MIQLALKVVKIMEFDFKQIAEGAYAFFNVGMEYWDPEKHILGVASIPYYVDTAFACELYMKAIIVFHNPDITKKEFQKIKHRLDKLFELLPMETQEKIRDKLPDQKIREMQEYYISQYKKLLSTDVSNIAKKKIENSALSFGEMLKQQATLFEDWRYYYEATDADPISCDEWFLYHFCSELHNNVAEIMNLG